MKVQERPVGPYGYVTTGRANEDLGQGNIYIVDANGRKIAAIWGRPDEKVALAEWICECSERAGTG